MSRVLACGVLASLLLAGACRREETPSPSIPVTSKVNWWPYAKNLSVDSLKVSQINEHRHPLNLFHSEFDLSIHLSGIVHGETGWRPYISELHVAELRVNPESGENYVARMVITPVVDVVEDKTYVDQPLRWNVNYVRHGPTMGWGSNRFIVQAGSIEKAVEIWQLK